MVIFRSFLRVCRWGRLFSILLTLWASSRDWILLNHLSCEEVKLEPFAILGWRLYLLPIGVKADILSAFMTSSSKYNAGRKCKYYPLSGRSNCYNVKGDSDNDMMCLFPFLFTCCELLDRTRSSIIYLLWRISIHDSVG